MASKDEKAGRSLAGAVAPPGPEEFAKTLKGRRQAALGLEQDLLTEVPLLYGSAGGLPRGDPGIVLAELHREALLRRNGGGVPNASARPSDVALPFERAMGALAVLLFLFFLFGG